MHNFLVNKFNKTSFAQESQKMCLECRVASNPSVGFQLDDFHFNCFNSVFNLITWMCRPVSVPAHPRILAGRWFLQISPNISPNISGEQGVAGFPEILAKLVHDSLKKIYFMKFLTNLRAQRGKIFKYTFDFSWVFLQKFLTTPARASESRLRSQMIVGSSIKRTALDEIYHIHISLYRVSSKFTRFISLLKIDPMLKIIFHELIEFQRNL